MCEMFKDKLTIVLTLRGRPLHTLRWLWHANRIHLPFHIIIADGEVNQSISRVLLHPELFPNLSYEYHQYSDATLSDFYGKCVDALMRVSTPYVVMSDNDDFIFPSGLLRSVAFLEHETEYVSAGGGVPGFSLMKKSNRLDGLVGGVRRIRYRYHNDGSYKCRDIDNPALSSRVLSQLKDYHVTYYHVYRTAAILQVAKEIVDHDFSDLEIHERYWSIRAVTLGKVKSDPTYFSLIRQQGTSSYSLSKHDWIQHLLSSRLPQDYSAMVTSIVNNVVKVDGCDQGDLEREMNNGCVAIVRRRIMGFCLRYRFPRLFAIKKWAATLPLPSVPPEIQVALDKNSLWRNLAGDGGNVDQVAAHAKELDYILTTLMGTGFLDFVRLNASEMLGDIDA